MKTTTTKYTPQEISMYLNILDDILEDAYESGNVASRIDIRGLQRFIANLTQK